MVAAAVLAATAFGASACSGDSATVQPAPDAGAGVPTILATTGIWGDVVANVACGGLAEVETIIPVGGDPHGYEPSLQDRARMESAALVVANGLLLEEGLEDTLEAVAESGTPLFEFAEGMDTIPYSFQVGHDHDEDEHEGHDHDEDEGHDDHEDEHEGHDHDEHEGENTTTTKTKATTTTTKTKATTTTKTNTKATTTTKTKATTTTPTAGTTPTCGSTLTVCPRL